MGPNLSDQQRAWVRSHIISNPGLSDSEIADARQDMLAKQLGHPSIDQLAMQLLLEERPQLNRDFFMTDKDVANTRQQVKEEEGWRRHDNEMMSVQLAVVSSDGTLVEVSKQKQVCSWYSVHCVVM